MTELSIRFTSEEKDETSPIQVALFRPDSGNATKPALFDPPLGDPQLKEIRWYLEIFSQWPTGPDYERAAGIESQLEDWGRALRDAIRANLDAADGGKQITIDAIDPRVLRLPWELLADEAGHLFAQEISIRRRLPKTTESKIKPLPLPVRILVVIARPDDAGFIDPRADAIALLDATDSLGDQVEVEFLYPPTLKALTNGLRDRDAPPVHVVHFDGHGLYDQKHGLGYLLFEKKDHKRNKVDAGYTVGQAVDEGRFALLQDIDRHTIARPDAAGDIVEEPIKLHDWFLPTLYQQADDPIIFDQPPGGGDRRSHEPPGGLEPHTIPTQQTYPRLARQIIDQFNKEELHGLCFQLGLDYDDLPGETWPRKA